MKICNVCGVNEANHGHKCVQCKNRQSYYKSMKPCECGCGETVAKRFLPGHHTRLLTSEEQSRRGQMNDGSATRGRGSKDTYTKVRGRHEHRRVMESLIGRSLTFDDIVHHLDGNKKNNHPDNLKLMTRAEHIKAHRQDIDDGRERKIRSLQVSIESSETHTR